MAPDPDQLTAELPKWEYFSENWATLPWTPWIPFSADKKEFRQIPKEPGLYRIRAAGRDELMYIGETKRALHQRLQDLRMELRGRNLMPWSDPHAEAPALCAWQDADACEYECSATPLDASLSSRRIMESYLLYRYRQESGGSPACNFGRFHPRYRKSTTRKEHLRGGKLAEGQKDNPAAGASQSPLTATGTPGAPGWMGLVWSPHAILAPETLKTVPAGPGLYLLLDAVSDEICMIGQSGQCAGRLQELSEKAWEGRELKFSFSCVERTVLPHQLRERENDLRGNYFGEFRKAPEFQFRHGP